MINPVEIDLKGGRKIVVTEPSVEPVTVDELKTWARIDGVDEDTLLEGIITNTRKSAELFLRTALISQTIELYMDTWENRFYELPYSPVISLDKIETLDEDDTATEYDSDNYYLVPGIPARVVIRQDSSLPSNTERDQGGYRITYTAGYGTSASDVPQGIRQGILAWATNTYENRVPDPFPPKTAINFLRNYVVLNR